MNSDYALSLWSIVEEFSWLLNLQLSDIFIVDFWNDSRFPSEWHPLESLLTQRDLLLIASRHSVKREEWPESFKHLVDRVFSLSIDRRTSVPMQSVQKAWGMKDKKSYEVSILTRVIHGIAQEADINHIVDIGAGQGYLSYHLAHTHGYAVTAIERQAMQTFESKAKKIHKAPMKGTLEFIRKTVNKHDWSDHSDNVLKGRDSLLCSLHACGDLSPTMLRIFHENSLIKAIVNVGCCYNLMSENQKESYGFPISQLLKNVNASLSIPMRKIAAQVTDTWSSSIEASLEAFKHHFYRAVLAFLMISEGLMQKDSGQPSVGKLPDACFSSFSTYAMAALKKLKVQHSLTDEIFNSYHDKCEHQFIRVAILWTVKSLLGSIVESLILMDRFLYLQEHGYSPMMLPLFDIAKSPRNIAIIAIKGQSVTSFSDNKISRNS